MWLPLIHGIIDRRILANYRVDPAALARLLPGNFRPKLVDGFGVAGICLIRLRGVRPRGFPAALGVSSENAAHRIAVEWDGDDGQPREGVYIPRRDTNSRLNVLAGGRVFTGVHHHARFDVAETNEHFDLRIRSDDGATRVHVEGTLAAGLPPGSVFGDLERASEFFRRGSLGYSPSKDPARLDALELHTHEWAVRPLDVTRIESSFFDDRHRFPEGSIRFDCALEMRNVAHEWHDREPMCVPCATVAPQSV